MTLLILRIIVIVLLYLIAALREPKTWRFASKATFFWSQLGL